MGQIDPIMAQVTGSVFMAVDEEMGPDSYGYNQDVVERANGDGGRWGLASLALLGVARV